MTVDEKGLEAVAQAIYAAACESYTATPRWEGEHGEVKALYRAQARAAITAYLSARSAEPVAWRHKKRGGLYKIVGEAQVQTSRPLEDYELVVVYRSLNTPDIDDPKSPMKGELWARPKAEFYDGRFEEASDV